VQNYAVYRKKGDIQQADQAGCELNKNCDKSIRDYLVKVTNTVHSRMHLGVIQGVFCYWIPDNNNRG